MDKILIPSKGNIRVEWSDKAENYSAEDKNKVKQYFSEKYNVPKSSVNIVFKPIKKDSEGNTIEISGSGIDNILDINYQHQLFKEWLKNEDITVVFNRILALDKKVNDSIQFNTDEHSHRVYRLIKLEINNLLCFGDDNIVEFSNLKGINIIESISRNKDGNISGNAGGKSTFSIDSLLFLFFGTTTKTDKNEEMFNQYRDKDTLKVKGIIEISGNLYGIERSMKRSLKKDGSYTVKNTVNYYEILSDGSEKPLDEENAIKTTKLITDTIGSESDFMTIIMANSDNLEDLIDTQPTARGKLLTRFIGLEVIEKKEQEARAMYNTFSKSMKSNQYNSDTLTSEILTHKTNIISLEKEIIEHETKLSSVKDVISNNEALKDKALLNKQEIDPEISNLDPNKLNREIEDITKKGKGESDNLAQYNKRITEIGIIEFNEQTYEDTLTLERNIKLSNERSKSEHATTLKNNDVLKKSGVCSLCGQTLKDVDHTEHIELNNVKILKLSEDIIKTDTELIEIGSKITELKKLKELLSEKDKLELKRDRCEVELTSLRNEIKSKNTDLKKYNLNNGIIELNRKMDVEITGYTYEIQRLNADKEVLLSKISKCKSDIETNLTNIENKTKIIDIIEKESQVERIYKVYIDMVGKKGISKMVLKSVIPIINFELYSLLDDVVDFNLEMEINSKNEVDFIIERDDVRKLLKSGSGLEKTASAIALRCVLARISNLPKPNFIGFDEVFGKVANENLDYMKLLFDKIKNIFDIVFIITHNDIVKNWSDNIITINKVNNVSSISIK